MRWSGSIAWVLYVLALAGCSQPIPSNLQPVQGQLTLNGRPLDGVRVFLLAENQAQNPTGLLPNGFTGVEGRFSIGYSQDHVGVPPGKYVVFFQQGEPADALADDEAEPPQIPSEFLSPRTSSVRFEVKPGENRLELDLAP